MASGKSQFHGADGQTVYKNWPPTKTASFDILRQLVLENGLRSLWKGMVPMLWRDVPFSAIYWSLAEGTRKFLLVCPPSLAPQQLKCLHIPRSGQRRTHTRAEPARP